MKRTKEQVGITLIALIITVVVLLVLAVVTIRAVQGDGIITHANDAKAEHILAQEKEKITLAANQAYLDGKGEIKKETLDSVLKVQFGEDGISYTNETTEFIQVKITSTGREYKVFFNGKIDGPLDVVENPPSGEIPPVDGGDDTTVSQEQFEADFTTWAATNLTDETTEFEYGDYIYKKGQCYNNSSWTDSGESDVWGVRVKDNYQTSYGMILGSISEENVSLKGTFSQCFFLETIPDIPNGVTNMESMLQMCMGITSLPANFRIPDGVTSVASMFSNCSLLTSLPADFTIPNSVTDVSGLFSGTGITSLPADFTIPNSVTNVSGMFSACSSLTSLPTDFTIPNSVTNVRSLFSGAGITSLPADFRIPDGVTNVSNMFSGCSSLTSLPANFTIPNSVTSVSAMFSSCSSLTSLPDDFTIPDSVTEIWEMFKNCTSLTLTNLENGLVIPSNVEMARETFSGCTSLTGTIVMNSTKIQPGMMIGIYNDFFKDTTQPITLTTTAGVSEELLNNMAGTSTAGNVTVEI